MPHASDALRPIAFVAGHYGALRQAVTRAVWAPYSTGVSATLLAWTAAGVIDLEAINAAS